MEALAAAFIAAAVWYGSANQTASALVALGLAICVAIVTFAVRTSHVSLATDRRSALRWLVTPALFVAAWLLRDPLLTATMHFRFSQAEPTLTAAAKAAMKDPNAPWPHHAGSFAIYERRMSTRGVVFYAKGAGYLVLKRCGFEYSPHSSNSPATQSSDRIYKDWYWTCEG